MTVTGHGRAPLLNVERLTKVFRGGVRANDDVSVALDAGEVLGMLGPNGAGKTTLVRQIVGLAMPTSGSITIAGVDVLRDPAHARRCCSFQPQAQLGLDGFTPRQAMELVGQIRGASHSDVAHRVDDVVSRLNLEEYVDRRCRTLSGGVRRLVAFGMATVVPGDVVVLDEPSNDVDPLRRALLWDAVRATADAGSAVLLVTHNVLEAERVVDRLAVMDRGRVIALGTPAELKHDVGGLLRLELTLAPGARPPEPPSFAMEPLLGSRRLLMRVAIGDAGRALEWALAQRHRGRVEEFVVGPVTLEDVYRALLQGRPHERGAAVPEGDDSEVLA
jgi:ABC-2 type transport system ATP-binding protein